MLKFEVVLIVRETKNIYGKIEYVKAERRERSRLGQRLFQTISPDWILASVENQQLQPEDAFYPQ